MRVLLLLFSTLAAAVLGLSSPAEILASANCIYIESSDTIDCSGVTSVEEVVAAMKDLSEGGQTKFTRFSLTGNGGLSYLPQSLLGDVQFIEITVTDNHNLYSIEDILGASKTSVLHLDISGNMLSYLPRMESSSLISFKMNGPYLTTIAANALNAVPNVQTIELQEAGQAKGGLIIIQDAFMNLPHLQELNLKDYYPKDNLATRGSFTFSSEELHTVNLIAKSPIMTAEAGTFGGFNSNTTLYLLLNAPIAIESFYTVFNSGSKVVVQELHHCLCNLDWVKYSCFLPQVTIRCVFQKYYYDLADVPDSNFEGCCFGKKSS